MRQDPVAVAHGQRAGQPVAADDLVDLAVGDRAAAVDPQGVVVEAGLDQVSDADEVAVAGLAEHLGRDPPGGDQLGPDLRRQLGGHRVGAHDQQRPVALQDVGQVAADRGRDHLLLGAAPDPPVRVVDRDHVRVAHAQPDRGGALPGVGEPVDLGQLDRAGVAHQQLEHAPGPDRGELLVVAGVEQLGAGGGDDRGDAVEVVGGAHAGLVDHDQVLGAQPVTHPALLVGVEPVQEPPGVHRGEPVLDEDPRGHVRGRHAEDPAADLLLPHAGPARRPCGTSRHRPGRSARRRAARTTGSAAPRPAGRPPSPAACSSTSGQLQRRPGQRGRAGAAGALDDRSPRSRSCAVVAYSSALRIRKRLSPSGRRSSAGTVPTSRTDSITTPYRSPSRSTSAARSCGALGDRRGADLLVGDRRGQVPDVPRGVALAAPCAAPRAAAAPGRASGSPAARGARRARPARGRRRPRSAPRPARSRTGSAQFASCRRGATA